jgi:hypothetical protein
VRRRLYLLGLTAVVLAFFLVWLPHPAAGLRYIGLEMGEQAKFLPQVSSGEIVPGRSLFYTPPVTAALLLIVLTTFWGERRWQTWVARGVAVAVSLLAFPALEALGDADRAEWLWRVVAIGVVVAATGLSGRLARLPRRWRWWLAVGLALAGVVLPTWAYLAVRPAFAALLRDEVGVGPGVWLNGAGHVAILVVAVERGWRERNPVRFSVVTRRFIPPFAR